MHVRSRAVHDAAIIIDALQISNWSEAVFRNMRRGGLTAVNCTVSVLENFRQTIANIIQYHRMGSCIYGVGLSHPKPAGHSEFSRLSQPNRCAVGQGLHRIRSREDFR